MESIAPLLRLGATLLAPHADAAPVEGDDHPLPGHAVQPTARRALLGRSGPLLFEDTGIYTSFPRTYDVAPDGDRFLMIKPESTNGDASQIVLVQNWTDELQRLVPTP